jgi:trehalose utilization protein
MSRDIKVVVWNEFRHEKRNDPVRKLYPDGMHALIALHLNGDSGIHAELASLDEPEHGLSESRLADTGVLIWWGHIAHNEVADEIVSRVQRRVNQGMGFIALHSAHASKPFRRLMGTGCGFDRHRMFGELIGERERLWVVMPSHPIAAGLARHFELEHEEMFGEFYDIPAPDELVFISWFQGGEVFRSGCCFTRGRGRVFYFRPGHEFCPTFHDPNVLRVISNAVRWAAPGSDAVEHVHEEGPLEPLS